MGPFVPVLIVALFAIILFTVSYFSGKKVILRTLQKLPHKPVNGLQPNVFSKVTGKALHVKEPLIAPYSRRKCIFYSIKIEQKKSTGKSSYWKTLVDEEKIQPFFVNVNDEFVIIEPTNNPKNYISHLVVDKKQRSGTFNDPTPEFRGLLNTYNISSENFVGWNKNLRYSEGIIEIGELITVAGMTKWKRLKEPFPDYPYSKIATLEATDGQKLIITDLPEAQKRTTL